ncbi:spectrin repeat-containing domain protein [Oesophagostomum dentatum]|uniref:Spectrin repeat-containing domain protein n=1 Tax=Oesophagostomum dentatum TaxID=61180 RepID=A0A0B1TGI0_OESDE|nr:spectrin repeat-containing domain protein [Oesophagostomum dentatum]
MLESSAKRRGLLCDSKKYHEFIRTCGELITWINAKLQLAYDESYLDPTNLRAKLQKHLAFDSELTENEKRLVAVEAQGEQLIKEKHFMSEQVRAQLGELRSGWDELRTKSALKTQRLREAYEAHTLQRKVEDMEKWLDRVAKFKDEVERLRARCDALQDQQNANQIAARQVKLETSYADLVKECNRRRTQLVDAGRYHRFVRQVDDLSDWLHDKEHLASSEDYGRDLEDCVQLTEKFETVVRELAGAGERVAAVQRAQEELLRSGHPYAASIRAKGTDLNTLWTRVNEAATERQQALAGARQVHRFDQEADETLNWLGDKEATGVAMENEDLAHADLATIKVQMQRHDEFVHGMRAVEKQVAELCREAERLWTAFPNTRDDWRHIDTVENAETQIRDYDDFLITLDAQVDRCDMVKRLTLIEQNFSRLRKKEVERSRIAEEDQKRRDTIKVVEKGQILANRRQERERRKTQEISLLRPNTSEDYASQTLPKKLDRSERSKTATLGETVIVGGPSTTVGSNMNLSANTSAMEVDMKKTPSFTTRRGHSITRNSTSRWEDMGAIDMRGFVDRKQDLQSGGKKATIRSWKNYYTILCGQLMCFFKDESAFYDNIAAAPPVYIYGARCEPFPEYVKRKHAYRLATQDGAEYVFACADERQMLEWVAKIKFHAGLTPSNQLKSYNYNASEAVPVAPPLRRYESRSSDEAPPPVPIRSSFRDDTSRPTSRVSAFDSYDGNYTLERLERTGSTVGREIKKWNDYNSLPRGTSIHVEMTSVRLCATLPRAEHTAQIVRIDSSKSLSGSGSHMPALLPRKATISRRPSTRVSIYAESVYGDLDEEDLSEENSNGGASSSLTSTPTGPPAPTPTMRVPSSTNGYMETLAYQEHSTSAYTRETTPHRDSRAEGVEFISWVENNQPQGRRTPTTQPPTPSSHNDTDSLKSDKKRFSLFGKRGSKSQK